MTLNLSCTQEVEDVQIVFSLFLHDIDREISPLQSSLISSPFSFVLFNWSIFFHIPSSLLRLFVRSGTCRRGQKSTQFHE